MKSKENLVFLGMMGSGKSSIGLMVSKKLNIDFIDVDREIEKKIGMSITKIFEKFFLFNNLKIFIRNYFLYFFFWCWEVDFI